MDIRKNPYFQWPDVTRYGSPEILLSKDNNIINKFQASWKNIKEKIDALNSKLADLQREVIYYNLVEAGELQDHCEKL